MHPDGQRAGDDGRERLGNRRDRQGDGEHGGAHQETQGDLSADRLPQGTDPDDGDANSQSDDPQPAADFLGPFFERRCFGLGGGDLLGDPAELGVHTRLCHDGFSPSVGHDRSGKDHILPLSRRETGTEGGGLFPDGDRFARQGGLVTAQRPDLDEAGVHRNLVPGLEEQDISGDKVTRGDVLFLAVAQDCYRRREHLLEGRQRPFGPVLLDKPEDGADQDDNGDHQRIHPFTDQQREAGGRQEDDDEQVLELLKEQGKG